MDLKDLHVSREHRYALSREAASGRPVFSIPVTNSQMEYEEYYRISEAELRRFLADAEAARAFAARCGRRELDERLILAPGPDRGSY